MPWKETSVVDERMKFIAGTLLPSPAFDLGGEKYRGQRSFNRGNNCLMLPPLMLSLPLFKRRVAL
jgi:hypothetical protein